MASDAGKAAGAAKDSATSGTAAAAAPSAAPSAPSTSARGAAAVPAAATSRRLAAGTPLSLSSAVTITSRRNHVGDTVLATVNAAALSGTGATVIPAGAELVGTITAIAPAENAGGHGTLTIAFNQLRIGTQAYAIAVRVDSLGTTMVGRGVTAGDAGKVGAGTAVGAVAGRIIGGNRTGTAVGAAVGTAAGAAVAVQTRDTDITIQTGAAIQVTLTRPFERPAAATN